MRFAGAYPASLPVWYPGTVKTPQTHSLLLINRSITLLFHMQLAAILQIQHILIL